LLDQLLDELLQHPIYLLDLLPIGHENMDGNTEKKHEKG
jgi:hypothetical protein